MSTKSLCRTRFRTSATFACATVCSALLSSLAAFAVPQVPTPPQTDERSQAIPAPGQELPGRETPKPSERQGQMPYEDPFTPKPPQQPQPQQPQQPQQPEPQQQEPARGPSLPRGAATLTPAQEEAQLGYKLVQEGKYDEAFQHFAEAVKLDPQEPDTYMSAGIAYRQLN